MEEEKSSPAGCVGFRKLPFGGFRADRFGRMVKKEAEVYSVLGVFYGVIMPEKKCSRTGTMAVALLLTCFYSKCQYGVKYIFLKGKAGHCSVCFIRCNIKKQPFWDAGA